MRSSFLRSLAAGVCGGALLAAVQPPLGLDLVRFPAVDGASAALFGALPWILLAGLLGPAARRFASGVPVAALLSGAVLGVALQGLFLPGLLRAESRLGLALAALAPAALLLLLVRGRGREPAAGDPQAPRAAEQLALLAAGAGLALALMPLAYHLRHLGLASEPEAAARALCFAGLLLCGALSFGPLVARGPGAPAALAGGLAAAAALCLVGAWLLPALADPRALDAYLRRFGLDFSLIGTLKPTLLLTGVLCIAPGLCAGAALCGARHRLRFAAVLLGAGAGVALWPVLVDLALDAPRAAAELRAMDAPAWTWRRVSVGIWIAAAGGGAAAWLGARGRARWAALAVAGAAALAPLASRGKPVWILSPWHRVPIEPLLAWNTGDGLFTVEEERGGARVLTLDRRRLTPLAEEEPHDAQRFDQAWRLLPREVRAGGAARVLYVGQLTPARVFALRAYPGLRIDHVVPWHAHRGPLDAALFGAEAPPANALSPGEARRRLASGSYDLVFAPPIHGPLVLPRSAVLIPYAPAPAPATAGWRVPEGTLAVAWVEAASPVACRALGERALLSSRGVYDFELGLLRGSLVPPDGDPEAPLVVATGARRAGPSPLAYLRQRPEARGHAAGAALFARLADANQGPAADLLRGLELLAASQRTSSPFESLAEQTELEDEALDLFARSASQGLDPFQRGLWEGIAELLIGKRMPDKVLAYAEPLAETYGPWAALERSVAAAYGEFTMAEEAAHWLRRAAGSAPYDIGLLVEAAVWTGRAGDHAGELELLRRAEALQPGRPDVERLSAMALFRAGDPEGRARVEALLAEHPEDGELADLLLAGPQAGPAGEPARERE